MTLFAPNSLNKSAFPKDLGITLAHQNYAWKLSGYLFHNRFKSGVYLCGIACVLPSISVPFVPMCPLSRCRARQISCLNCNQVSCGSQGMCIARRSLQPPAQRVTALQPLLQLQGGKMQFTSQLTFHVSCMSRTDLSSQWLRPPPIHFPSPWAFSPKKSLVFSLLSLFLLRREMGFWTENSLFQSEEEFWRLLDPIGDSGLIWLGLEKRDSMAPWLRVSWPLRAEACQDWKITSLLSDATTSTQTRRKQQT